MYLIKVTGKDYEFAWKTDHRPTARALQQIALENGCKSVCSVDVPASNRIVKFKGVA